MPFFWVGGFGSGILSALIAGATLVTEEIPRARDHAATTGAREGHAVPRLARPGRGAGTPGRRRPSRSVRTATRQPGRAAARGSARRARRAGEAVRDDRVVRSVLRLPRRHRHAAIGVGKLRKAVRRHGGSHRRRRQRRAAAAQASVGMIQIRGPHTLRGMCRRSREELFTADGFYPTGDLGRLDDDGFLFYHGRSDDMFKVSGATVYPSEVERVAAHDRREARHQRADSGCGQPSVPGSADQRVRRASAELSSPTVWLLLDRRRRPARRTGKVDVDGCAGRPTGLPTSCWRAGRSWTAESQTSRDRDTGRPAQIEPCCAGPDASRPSAW